MKTPSKLRLTVADLHVTSFTVPGAGVNRGTVRGMSGDPELCIPETPIDTTVSIPESDPSICLPKSKIEICLPLPE